MAKRILKTPAAVRNLTPMERQALQDATQDAAEGPQDATAAPDDVYHGFDINTPQPPNMAAEPAENVTTASGKKIPEHVLAVPGMAEALEVAQLSAEPEEDTEDTEDNETGADSGADLDADEKSPAICPWCGNSHEQTPPQLTDEDKIKFIATIRGPTRFTRTYELFNGELVATFRTRTPWETNQILKQLNADVSAGEILTAADYAQRLTDYQLCVEIQSIVRAEAIPLRFLPLREIDYDKNAYPTPLPELYQYVFDEVLQTETVRQAVGQSWLDFTARFNHMLARKDDPDFFTGIRSAG